MHKPWFMRDRQTVREIEILHFRSLFKIWFPAKKRKLPKFTWINHHINNKTTQLDFGRAQNIAERYKSTLQLWFKEKARGYTYNQTAHHIFILNTHIYGNYVVACQFKENANYISIHSLRIETKKKKRQFFFFSFWVFLASTLNCVLHFPLQTASGKVSK